MGVDAFSDIRALSGTGPSIVFDVGANVGQSVERFAELLPGSEIHAFEPSPTAFEELRRSTRRFPNVRLINAAVGASPGDLILLENDHTNMSSFLSPGSAGWGRVVRHTPVAVLTVDDYCARQQIERIDLLKIDTQGYELKVLEGASGLIEARQIGLVYLEITFAHLYEGLPDLGELYRVLTDRGYRLVAFYNFVVRDGVAGWCDALFRAVVADSHVTAS